MRLIPDDHLQMQHICDIGGIIIVVELSNCDWHESLKIKPGYQKVPGLLGPVIGLEPET